MKNVLIVGFGLSGKSAAQFLISRGMQVAAVDDKIIESPSVEVFKELPEGISFDYAICSPGIPPTHPVIRQLHLKSIQVISEAQLAFDHIKNPIVGVSGTNGKTTVTLLTAHILNACGKKARALGNVGVPLTSAVDTLTSDEIVVAELSSYQLEDLKGPLLDASVLLNITPDHLDRYQTMDNYARAKMELHKITKDPSRFFIDERTYSEYKALLKDAVSCYGYTPDQKLSTDLKSIFIDGRPVVDLPAALQNKKNHDLENFLAAFALAWSMGADPKAISAAYDTFIKPHHRIEFIREVSGIKFYDDSKGTNIDAVIRAVESMEGPIHLIAGGVDKGASYTLWIPVFDHVKKIYAIGQAAQKIQAEVGNSIEVEIYPSLESAVTAAYQNAKGEENVLLSPGCSSFDMFKDYVDRGLTFQKLVFKL